MDDAATVRVRTSAPLLLALAACPRAEPPATAPPLPAATRDSPDDPLREPPELHLRRVRQLSFGGRAGPPLFAEGGKELAFLVWPPDGGAAVPHLVEVDTAREVPVAPVPGGEAASDLWLSPRGEACVDLRAACPGSGACAISQAMPAAAALSPAAAACVPPRFPVPRQGGCAATAASDWACLLVGPSSPRLWLWPAGAPAPRDLGPAEGLPAFSPDGHRLAWTRLASAASALPGSSTLAIVPLGGGGPVELGPPDQKNRQPAWFPGGRALLFASNADDAAGRDVDLFRIGDDGEELVRVTFAAGSDHGPAISPDGQRIAWVSERNAAEPGESDVLVADWAE